MAEKVKSPNMPKILMLMAQTKAITGLISIKWVKAIVPKKLVITMPPINPASVLLGLIKSTILFLPKSLPKRN